ncbi:MAG: chromate transporter [Clostridia bacterium]|nr:chromate transporter [Clostridia bacterium]
MILLELFWTFFKIGLFTFGGGYAMLPMIQSEVLAKQWINHETLINFVAVSESTPGPFAINMATFIGTEMGGILGGMVATLGVVLPSFIVILIVARFFEKFRDSKFVRWAMSGLKPAVIGLIGAAIISIGKTVFFPNGFTANVFTSAPFYLSLALFIICTVLILRFKKIHPILLICISAAVGIAAGYALQLPV